MFGGCADRNASDKTVSNALLTDLREHMTGYGRSEGAFVYVVDAAIGTSASHADVGKNLLHHARLLGCWEIGL